MKLILKYFTSPLKKNPQNTKELNKIIEEMDAEINHHQHFAEIFKGGSITGVPVRFALIPIKQFLDIKIEKFYSKLKDVTIVKFTEMLQEIQDFKRIFSKGSENIKRIQDWK
jgi:hypothetical protein